MESRVELLSFWASPFAMRVEFALAAKGIPYHKVEQDLINKSQLLLDSNPIHKKVPVLIHNGKPICESSIIVQYIHDTWPDGCQIMPKDPYELAMVRFWVNFVDTKLVEPIRWIMLKKGEEQKPFIVEAMEGLTILENHAFNHTMASNGPFFGGSNTVGFFDIALGPFIVWFPALETVGEFSFDFENKFPLLYAFIQAFKEWPYASTILPDPEKVTQLVIARRRSSNQ